MLHTFPVAAAALYNQLPTLAEQDEIYFVLGDAGFPAGIFGETVIEDLRTIPVVSQSLLRMFEIDVTWMLMMGTAPGQEEANQPAIDQIRKAFASVGDDIKPLLIDWDQDQPDNGYYEAVRRLMRRGVRRKFVFIKTGDPLPYANVTFRGTMRKETKALASLPRQVLSTISGLGHGQEVIIQGPGAPQRDAVVSLMSFEEIVGAIGLVMKPDTYRPNNMGWSTGEPIKLVELLPSHWAGANLPHLEKPKSRNAWGGIRIVTLSGPKSTACLVVGV
jgi:L-fucose mutarotase/ribose pyranase (RbsD/FucU family)